MGQVGAPDSFLGIFFKGGSAADVAVPRHLLLPAPIPLLLDKPRGPRRGGGGQVLPPGWWLPVSFPSSLWPPAPGHPPGRRAPSTLHTPRLFLKLALPTRGQISEPETVKLFI